jgi:hypothetical protein
MLMGSSTASTQVKTSVDENLEDEGWSLSDNHYNNRDKHYSLANKNFTIMQYLYVYSSLKYESSLS